MEQVQAILAIVRDVLLIVYLTLGIVVALVLLFLSIQVFRKVGPLLETVQATMKTIQTSTEMFADLALMPFIRVSSFYTGVRQGFKALRWIRRRRGGR